MKDLERVEVKSRRALRAWLTANHGRSDSIWLVTYKKAAGRNYLPYEDIVEEALAFGWVDSLPRSLDDNRSMRRLSPRKPASSWSQANRRRVEKLVAAGRMHKAGLAKVEIAKSNGAWGRTSAAEGARVPSDLRRALADNAVAQKHFDAFPRSSKRIILEWIGAAKRDETRSGRIRETVEKAAINIRANHFRQPAK